MMAMSSLRRLSRIVIGARLSSAEAEHQRLPKILALPVFSSDALSSVAYATEEILIALVAGAALATTASLPIACAITALLVIVSWSYMQTIEAYPTGGGAYIVARSNIGPKAGLVAGASLLIDYVLTVSVSVAAGVAAIASLCNVLAPRLAASGSSVVHAAGALLGMVEEHKAALGVAVVLGIMLANLRGVKESGKTFALPTYGFIVAMLALVLVGVARLLSGTLAGQASTGLGLGEARDLGLLLFLRAFAGGCSAMTGIEAISNCVPQFEEPVRRNAKWTLGIMALLLGTMFLGITYLAVALQVRPSGSETVVSQVARGVFGVGTLYSLVQLATALILVLGANTSFADFPNLSRVIAQDGYLPRQLALRGDRLVYSNGIVLLGAVAAALIAIFHGEVDALMPLYAIGVFLSFTLSQAGMVRFWSARRSYARAAINVLGAVATCVVLVVIAATKLAQGAWIVLLLVPVLVGLMLAVSRHYARVQSELAAFGAPRAPRKEVKHLAIVAVSELHEGTVRALEYARSIAPADTVAVTCAIDPEKADELRARWEAWAPGVPLVVLESPYRSVVEPLLAYVEARDRERGDDIVTVVVPEVVPSSLGAHVLHNQTALLLKAALRFRAGTVVTTVPLHLGVNATADWGPAAA
jgi:amino acid transporter